MSYVTHLGGGVCDICGHPEDQLVLASLRGVSCCPSLYSVDEILPHEMLQNVTKMIHWVFEEIVFMFTEPASQHRNVTLYITSAFNCENEMKV